MTIQNHKQKLDLQYMLHEVRENNYSKRIRVHESNDLIT